MVGPNQQKCRDAIIQNYKYSTYEKKIDSTFKIPNSHLSPIALHTSLAVLLHVKISEFIVCFKVAGARRFNNKIFSVINSIGALKSMNSIPSIISPNSRNTGILLAIIAHLFKASMIGNPKPSYKDGNARKSDC